MAPAEQLMWDQGLSSAAKIVSVHAEQCYICLYKPCERRVGRGGFVFLFETYFQSYAAGQDDESSLKIFSFELSSSPLAK
jgi:hypothetical protein